MSALGQKRTLRLVVCFGPIPDLVERPKAKQAWLGLLVGRRAVFTSKIKSSPGPAKINHSRGVVSDASPCKISVQCHVVMIFIFPTVALVLISCADWLWFNQCYWPKDRLSARSGRRPAG
jgi:hypothetical protein